MPRLSTFYGIVVSIFSNDHPPPHVHARYGRHRASVAIATGRVIRGRLPPRARRRVKVWIAEHRDELVRCWELASRGEAPGTIAPLE